MSDTLTVYIYDAHVGENHLRVFSLDKEPELLKEILLAEGNIRISPSKWKYVGTDTMDVDEMYSNPKSRPIVVALTNDRIVTRLMSQTSAFDVEKLNAHAKKHGIKITEFRINSITVADDKSTRRVPLSSDVNRLDEQLRRKK